MVACTHGTNTRRLLNEVCGNVCGSARILLLQDIVVNAGVWSRMEQRVTQDLLQTRKMIDDVKSQRVERESTWFGMHEMSWSLIATDANQKRKFFCAQASTAHTRHGGKLRLRRLVLCLTQVE